MIDIDFIDNFRKIPYPWIQIWSKNWKLQKLII